jgi:hypothetical protein
MPETAQQPSEKPEVREAPQRICAVAQTHLHRITVGGEL